MPMITKEGTSSQSKVSSFKSFRLASDSAQGHFFRIRLEIIKMFPFKNRLLFIVALQCDCQIQKVVIRYSDFQVEFQVVSSQSNCRDLLTRLFYQIIYRSMNMVNKSIQYYSFLPYQMVQKFNNSKFENRIQWVSRK